MLNDQQSRRLPDHPKCKRMASPTIFARRSRRHGVGYAELATQAGAERSGTALAMGNTGVFLVLFGTPIVASALVAHWGWGTLWLGCAVCGVAAAALFPRVVRSASPSSASIPEPQVVGR